MKNFKEIVNLFNLKSQMNFGELTQYPFRADVWGTTSDVLMVVVTTATLFALIKTLKSQNRAIKLQDEAINLQRIAFEEQATEKQLYKLQLRPDVDVVYRPAPTFGFENEDKGVEYNIVFKIVNADSYEFYCKDVEGANNGLIYPEEIFYLENQIQNYPKGREFKTEIRFDPIPQHNEHQPLNRDLVFYFKDSLGNAYKKNITLKSNGRVDIKQPIPITSSPHPLE